MKLNFLVCTSLLLVIGSGLAHSSPIPPNIPAVCASYLPGNPVYGGQGQWAGNNLINGQPGGVTSGEFYPNGLPGPQGLGVIETGSPAPNGGFVNGYPTFPPSGSQNYQVTLPDGSPFNSNEGSGSSANSKIIIGDQSIKAQATADNHNIGSFGSNTDAHSLSHGDVNMGQNGVGINVDSKSGSQVTHDPFHQGGNFGNSYRPESVGGHQGPVFGSGNNVVGGVGGGFQGNYPVPGIGAYSVGGSGLGQYGPQVTGVGNGYVDSSLGVVGAPIGNLENNYGVVPSLKGYGIGLGGNLGSGGGSYQPIGSSYGPLQNSLASPNSELENSYIPFIHPDNSLRGGNPEIGPGTEVSGFERNPGEIGRGYVVPSGSDMHNGVEVPPQIGSDNGFGQSGYGGGGPVGYSGYGPGGASGAGLSFGGYGRYGPGGNLGFGGPLVSGDLGVGGTGSLIGGYGVSGSEGGVGYSRVGPSFGGYGVSGSEGGVGYGVVGPSFGGYGVSDSGGGVGSGGVEPSFGGQGGYGFGGNGGFGGAGGTGGYGVSSVPEISGSGEKSPIPYIVNGPGVSLGGSGVGGESSPGVPIGGLNVNLGNVPSNGLTYAHSAENSGANAKSLSEVDHEQGQGMVRYHAKQQNESSKFHTKVQQILIKNGGYNARSP